MTNPLLSTAALPDFAAIRPEHVQPAITELLAAAQAALDEAVKSGRVKRGQTLMLQGVGGGFTWGSVLLKY